MKKICSTVVLALVTVAVVALIVIGVFLDHIVKNAIGRYGPRMTRTSVAVDAVHLSLLTGSANVQGLIVGNPQGYKTSQAIGVGTIAVGVDPMSVFSRKIVIRTIRIESPQITFEGGLAGNNLGQILDNVNSQGQGGGTLSTNAAAQPKSARTFEVDDLVITGAKVQVVFTGAGEREQQMMSLPDIHLTDLGGGKEGITAADLTRRVLGAISTTTIKTVARAAANLDKNASTLKQAGGNALKQFGGALKGFLNNKQ